MFGEYLKAPRRCIQRKFIANGAETEYAADCDVGQKGVMAETFAREYVAQMNFDERDRHAEQRVTQRDAGVSQRARIDQHECGAVGPRRV